MAGSADDGSPRRLSDAVRGQFDQRRSEVDDWASGRGALVLIVLAGVLAISVLLSAFGLRF